MNIILASKSPRRREILESLGVKFQILTADADEHSDITDPEQFVKALAERKGRAVIDMLSSAELRDTLVIACDTVVFANGEILGKPKNAEHAKAMLKTLSDGEHFVFSGLYLFYNGKEERCAESTRVVFNALSDSDIERYVALGEPFDKAGAYAIQGKACVFVRRIEGDYLNVVGLPASLLYNVLRQKLGIDLYCTE